MYDSLRQLEVSTISSTVAPNENIIFLSLAQLCFTFRNSERNRGDEAMSKPSKSKAVATTATAAGNINSQESNNNPNSQGGNNDIHIGDSNSDRDGNNGNSDVNHEIRNRNNTNSSGEMNNRNRRSPGINDNDNDNGDIDDLRQERSSEGKTQEPDEVFLVGLGERIQVRDDDADANPPAASESINSLRSRDPFLYYSDQNRRMSHLLGLGGEDEENADHGDQHPQQQFVKRRTRISFELDPILLLDNIVLGVFNGNQGGEGGAGAEPDNDQHQHDPDP